jgi:hypothetical protein
MAMHTTLLLAAILCGADPPAAAAVSSADDKQRQEEVSRLAPAKARMLKLTVGDEEPAQATLHTEPLLRWSNPIAGSVYGEVFLWHVDGRPAALASIFRWYHPFKDGTVEIVSLSPSPVQAREQDEVKWDCRNAGVSFQAAKGLKPPATSRGGRLVQMRDFLRQFAVELSDRRGGETVSRELRLLNQPIYRYESKKYGVIDGALFAFAEANDPEVIVIVEAYGAGGGQSWRYALARMNNHEMQVRVDGAVIKSWPLVDEPWKDVKSSYAFLVFDPASVKIDQPPAKP